MFYDKNAEVIMEKIPDMRIVYGVVAGLTYREIAMKYYYHQINKVVYRVRQLYKTFNLANRRHLAYFAVKNHLINAQKLEEYINA